MPWWIGKGFFLITNKHPYNGPLPGSSSVGLTHRYTPFLFSSERKEHRFEPGVRS